MKKIFNFLVFLVGSVCATFAQSEDAAIKKMIESESRAFHENTDRNAFINYWSLAKGSIMVYSGNGSCTVFSGEQMKDAAASGQIPKPDNAKVEMSNYVIRANGNLAWAIFDQKTTTPDGKSSYQHEFRCLEKSGSDWKIVGSSVHSYEPK
jgi:hypothetical protein